MEELIRVLNPDNVQTNAGTKANEYIDSIVDLIGEDIGFEIKSYIKHSFEAGYKEAVCDIIQSMTKEKS